MALTNGKSCSPLHRNMNPARKLAVEFKGYGYLILMEDESLLDGDFSAAELRQIADLMDKLKEILAQNSKSDSISGF